MSDILEERKSQLSSKYCDRLKSDVTILESVDWTQEDAALLEVRHIAHRISGSAALFGHPALAQPAQDIEMLIDEQASPGNVKKALSVLIDGINEAISQQSGAQAENACWST